jgi:hypothetical protein
MTHTVVIMTGLVIALVIGSIFGALYLEHAAQGDGGSGNAATAQATVQDGLSAAKQYAREHGFVTLASDPLDIVALVPLTDGITVGSVSNADTQVGVFSPTSSVVILVALEGGSQDCDGVVDVFATQAKPVFSDYSQTADVGVYYFDATTSSTNVCVASSVTPPGGPQFISTTGFPTASP